LSVDFELNQIAQGLNQNLLGNQILAKAALIKKFVPPLPRGPTQVSTEQLLVPLYQSLVPCSLFVMPCNLNHLQFLVSTIIFNMSKV